MKRNLFQYYHLLNIPQRDTVLTYLKKYMYLSYLSLENVYMTIILLT